MALKQEILRLVDGCMDIHLLNHIKLLLESEAKTASIVKEPAIQMAAPNIKQVQEEIIALVDEEEDIDFLLAIKDEFSPATEDTIQYLSPTDKEELLELIDEPFGKDTISHEEFLKSMARWDTK